MIVKIDLRAGCGRDPKKSDMQKSIDAVEKASNGQVLTDAERMLLVDVGGILKNLQKQLR